MFPNIENLLWFKWWYTLEKWFEREMLKLLRWLWYICFKPQDVWLSSKFLDIHFITKEWQCYWLELKKIKAQKEVSDVRIIMWFD